MLPSERIAKGTQCVGVICMSLLYGSVGRLYVVRLFDGRQMLTMCFVRACRDFHQVFAVQSRRSATCTAVCKAYTPA